MRCASRGCLPCSMTSGRRSWLRKRAPCRRVPQVRLHITHWRSGEDLSVSSIIRSWSYPTPSPRTPCAPSRSEEKTGSTSAAHKLDQRSPPSSPSSRAAADSACRSATTWQRSCQDSLTTPSTASINLPPPQRPPANRSHPTQPLDSVNHAVARPLTFDTSMKQRVTAQGTNQCTLGLPDPHDGLAADRQQRLQLAPDIRVGLHQL